MRFLSSLVLFCADFLPRALRRLWMLAVRPAFGSYGRNFVFDPGGSYSFENIQIGDDVSLGYRPCLLASLSKIRIGSKVMFGPHVTIIGGDHNTAVVGGFMHDVLDKCPGDDEDVVIEDDVWIGTRVVILKGVVIGRGSIVAAGAVVTKSVPPYSIAAGIPARVIARRWEADVILEHEKSLYPLERRLTRAQLEPQEKTL